MPTQALPDDSIDTLIANQLPQWLLDTPAPHRAALHAALIAQEQAQARLRQILAAVTPLDEFAAPLLAARLQAVTGRTLDVRRSRLQKVLVLPDPPPLPGRPAKRVRRFATRQDLLSCALHNYLPGDAFSPQSALLDEHGKRLELAPAQFAELCRSLDIGARYQAHLEACLRPASVQPALAAAYQANLEAAAHLAHRRGTLRATAYQRLQRLFSPATPAQDDLALEARALRLLGKPVVGVVVVETSVGGVADGVLTWIADDPVSPFNWHPSWPALYTALAGRLADPAYQAFFQRFLAEHDRHDFNRRLAGLLAAAGPVTPVELDGRHAAIDGTLFNHLAREQIERMIADARVLAVPTDDEDRAARDQRLRGYAEAGLTVLGLASLFVPALGVVMLGVTALQVAADVYEGYQDWQLGDREQALGHVFDVADIIASSVALGAAGHVVGKALPRRAFVDGLTPVAGAAGKWRLGYERQALDEPRMWQSPGRFLQHLGGDLSSVSEAEASSLLESTGFTLDRLRRLHLEQAPAPALLEDAIARLRLRQQLPGLHGEAFEAHLVAQQAQPDAAQAVLLRDFPGLTQRGARELVEQATQTQLDSLLEQQRVPLALAERARWLLHDGRVNRACAGLREAGLLAPDSERLALAMLNELAPWPASVRVELREASADGRLLAHAGKQGAAEKRLILRGKAGYLCVDGMGSALADANASDSLAQALLLQLDPAQRVRLGGVRLKAGQLDDALARHAHDHRSQVAAALGMVTPGGGIRPPVRLWDGRFGYPLSGRAESSRQALLRGFWQIYPTLSESELEAYLESVRARGIDLWGHLHRLQGQLGELRAALGAWSMQPSGVFRLLSRRRVADHIRHCWQRNSAYRQGAGQRLSLDGEHIGELPSLPEGLTFEHVTELTLRNMALTGVNMDFLGRFPNLRTLNLRHNMLSRFPAGLEQLTALQDLRLGDNQIVLDADGEQRLGALAGLRRLDLSNNPLRREPALGGLRQLRQYSLRGCQLREVSGAAAHPPLLEHADLRDNQISQLPPDLLALPQQRLQRLSLHDNPLPAGSEGTLAHADDGAASRALWLGEQGDPLRAQRWERLRQAQGSADFFRFLADLGHSTEFRRNQAAMRARAWAIIEACEQNQEIRQAVFLEAAGESSCRDRLLLVLSNIEVRTRLVRRLAHLPAQGAEREMLLEGRALFRLDEVQRIAGRHYQQALQVWRSAQATVPAPDDVEIFLAYRVNLAERLGLPDQPQGMYYADHSGVSLEQINAARQAVLAAESPTALSRSLLQREFWTDYLRQVHEQRFEQMNAPFHEQLEAHADAARHGPEQTFLVAIEPLLRQREAAEKVLLRELTEAAIARHRLLR
ncbi:NEL-type E3 ubiquitin ligase domain-containing protein [Pseudomonas sp. UFMG81]|uniref:NEL-type E3 ubiquitin ligase domain-containing protein n=1 Tax=Pseudomonas sp. UFMG81 TaxID=2745936 RepID=UPI00188F2B04|nr:NEL-type E3 ubiquitin ligase domain-containing protein [Pseudomonas sp. UFMG81]